jgi:hypothetical protein
MCKSEDGSGDGVTELPMPGAARKA